MALQTNQIDYILGIQRWRSSIKSAKTRPGADCGSDHELLIAKFRLKLKKVEKTTRPFRYDLNQILYTVEVRNTFKGLDLMDRVPEDLWTEVHDIVQETGIKTIPKKKKCKKAKRLSEEALQIAVKRRKVKREGEKERYKHLNAVFQRIARRGKRAVLSAPTLQQAVADPACTRDSWTFTGTSGLGLVYGDQLEEFN